MVCLWSSEQIIKGRESFYLFLFIYLLAVSTVILIRNINKRFIDTCKGRSIFPLKFRKNRGGSKTKKAAFLFGLGTYIKTV